MAPYRLTYCVVIVEAQGLFQDLDHPYFLGKSEKMWGVWQTVSRKTVRFMIYGTVS